jgi:hypothetical protein
MLCRYINGASSLVVSRKSVISTPRRSSYLGTLQGAEGTAYPIFGNRSSLASGLELGDDCHESVRKGALLRMTLWISSHIFPFVVRAGLNDNLGDPFSQAIYGSWSIVPSHSTDRCVRYATGNRNNSPR